ncbi:MAG: hypothetical protein ACYST6_13155 [Planctomycetota bacterium]|jgi:hypothetical protein
MNERSSQHTSNYHRDNAEMQPERNNCFVKMKVDCNSEAVMV